MKKKLFLGFFLTLAISLSAFAVSCKKDQPTQEAETPSTYTVTYSGTDIPAVTLDEGATVVKPEDPERAGQVFVGWYTDSSYDTKYSFGAAIKADVTIYARFVTPAAKEYTVTYVNGGETVATFETVGGLAVNAPEVTSAGHTFVGWWISDYESADKLTYKYDDREPLGQNVTLYAVWDKEGVSVRADEITWGAKNANSHYEVDVKKDGKTVANTRLTGGTKYAFDFTAEEAGEYVVSVTVDNETTTAYYRNKALKRVSSFEVVGNSILVYNEVENAEEYYITIDCGNENHKHTLVDNGSKLAYDFSGCDMKKDGISFTVTAKGEGYLPSVSKTYVHVANLDEVSGLKVDADSNVVWDKVKNAEYYELTVGEDVVEVYGTSYSLRYYGEGEYAVKVEAKAHGYNSSVATANYTKTTLAAPKNVRVSGTTVTWDEVEGADGYVVTVDGDENAAATNSYVLGNLALGSDLSFTVSAVKGGVKSVPSVSVKVADYLSDLSYADGYVTWDVVYGANAYRISVDGGKTVDVTTNAYCPSFASKGEHVVAVSSVKGRIVSAPKFIVVYAYEVSFDTDGGSAVNSMYLGEGSVVKLNTVPTKYGYELDNWYNVKGAAAAGGKEYDLGTFKVKKDVTLYAQWTPKTITVTLDNLDGSEATEFDITFGENYELPVPTNADAVKVFGGWFSGTDAGSSTRFTDETGASLKVWSEDRNDFRLYAGWLETLKYALIKNETEYAVSAGSGAAYVSTIRVPETYNNLPVSTVEGGAFRNLVNLETVEIPDTIQNVETGTAFLGCSNIKNINVYETTGEFDPDKKVYYSEDGVLFYRNVNNEGVELSFFPTGKTGSYTLPEGVEVIPLGIFRTAQISELVVASTVRKIDANAFSSFTLRSIVFKNGTETELEINERAFANCNTLTSLILPRRLKTFDASVLAGCPLLSEIGMDGEGVSYSAKDGVLLTKDGDEIVYCPPAMKNYTIPSTVSTIGKSAFAGAKFKTLVIPGNVEKINEKAFYNATSLTSITFEGTKGTLAIGAYAFANLTSLTEVVLPANLTSLAAYAFADNKALVRVTVNSGSEVEFAAKAFSVEDGGSNIMVINVGKDFYCDNFGGVFGGSSLEKINVDAENDRFFAENNVLYAYNRKTATDDTLSVQYYPEGLQVETFEINDKVTLIGDRVFQGKTTLKNIVIPASVETIGTEAFMGCTGLVSVTFSERTAELTINEAAFKNCTSLKEISLPKTMVKLGKYDVNGKLETLDVFEGCSSLTAINVEEGNEYFASSAEGILYGKTNGVADIIYLCPEKVDATEFVVPATVNKIFNYAFKNNSTLTSVTFEAETLNDETFSLGKGAFSGASALATCVLPEGLKIIGDETFMNSGLTSFECPNSVVTLGLSSFQNTRKLTTFTFKADRTSGISLAEGEIKGSVDRNTTKSVFINSAITSIALPAGNEDSKTSIGAFSFAYCERLQSVVLPSDMTVVPMDTFYYCSNLSEVNFPEGLVRIEGGAFRNTKVTTVKFPQSLEYVGSGAFSGVRITSLDLGGVKRIESNAFYSNMLRDTLTIPNTVEYIGGMAFTNMSNRNLTAIKFEDDDEYSTREELGLGTFGGGTFYSLRGLTEVWFPKLNGDKEIKVYNQLGEENAIFVNCTNLRTVHVTNAMKSLGLIYQNCPSIKLDLSENTNFEEVDGVLYGDQRQEIVMAIEDDFDTEILKIPEGVKIISSSAFANKDCIKEVYFPASLEKIGSQAFYNCLNLEKVEFDPNTVADVEIGERVFRIELWVDEFDEEGEWISSSVSESKLTQVQFAPSMTTIGVNMFANSGLTEVTTAMFPGVIDIGSSAFENNYSLRKVDLSGNSELRFGNNYSTDSMGDGNGAFNYCYSLSEVKFPDSVTSIPGQMFYECRSLKSIDLPSGVQYICSGAFQMNGYVDGSGVIAQAVKERTGVEIDKCFGLESITLPDAVMVIGDSAFINNLALKTVSIGETVNSAIASIESEAFSGCSALEKIEFYGAPYRLASGAFAGCESLETIEFMDGVTVTSIPNGAFRGLSTLTTFNMPDSVTNIGANAFNGCVKLDVQLPDSVQTIGDYAFFDTAISGEVNIPGAVTSIGTAAFGNCPNITSFLVDMTNSVYSSGTYGELLDVAGALVAFPAASEETSYTVANIGAIRTYAFSSSSLEEVIIPSTVLTIGEKAFDRWTVDQRIIFEVAKANKSFYGEWNGGCKATVFYSGGEEEEDPPHYMNDEFDATNVLPLLASYVSSDTGIHIRIDKVMLDVQIVYGLPDYEPEEPEPNSYIYQFSAKSNVVWLSRNTGYQTIQYMYVFDPVNNTYDFYSNFSNAWSKQQTGVPYTDAAEVVLTAALNSENWIFAEFATALTAYAGVEDSMVRTEEVFAERDAYRYKLGVYDFVIDKATGICLYDLGESYSNTEDYGGGIIVEEIYEEYYECVEFETNIEDLVVPTVLEDED